MAKPHSLKTELYWETFITSPFITALCQTIKAESYFSWEIKTGC